MCLNYFFSWKLFNLGAAPKAWWFQLMTRKPQAGGLGFKSWCRPTKVWSRYPRSFHTPPPGRNGVSTVTIPPERGHEWDGAGSSSKLSKHPGRPQNKHPHLSAISVPPQNTWMKSSRPYRASCTWWGKESLESLVTTSPPLILAAVLPETTGTREKKAAKETLWSKLMCCLLKLVKGPWKRKVWFCRLYTFWM